MKKYLMCLVIGILVAGCTAQDFAKDWGGSVAINIPADKKVVNVTWKGEGHLWILTRPRRADDIKETWHFTESSSWHKMEGLVILVEK